MICSGIKLTGRWRGYPCSNQGKYKVNGELFCIHHVIIAKNEPHRFKEAEEFLERKLERQTDEMSKL